MILEESLRQAIEHHNAGRLQEAGECYLAILQNNPQHAAANHNMGMLAVQMDQPAAGLPYLEAALDVNPAQPQFWLSYIDALHLSGHNDDARQILALARKQGLEGAEVDSLDARIDASEHSAEDANAYFNQAAELKITGRLEEAVVKLRQAVRIDPDFGAAYYNLGNTLVALGQLNPAVENYRHAAQRIQNNALIYNNLGVALHKLQQHEDSEASLREALRIDPDCADAHYNLGNTLRAMERFDEAQKCYERTLSLQNTHDDALYGIAASLHQQGQSITALHRVTQLLGTNESAEAKNLFVSCIKNLQLNRVDEDVRAMLVRAMTEPWGRPAELMHVVIDVIKMNADSATSITHSTDPLWFAVLMSAPVCDVELERSLTSIRQQILNSINTDPATDTPLEFISALACQCFINEYVFACSDEETHNARALRNRVEDALAAGAPVPEQWLLVLAAYFPLYSIKHAVRILEQPWSSPVMRIVTQQVHEPAEEQRLRATIPQLTPIADVMSLAVQQQYEENPYPRWIKCARLVEAKPLQEFLREKFPFESITSPASEFTCEILVAGCGTGLHPIATAQRIAHAKVLAIDLSRNSLAYAQRKANKLGITSIDFLQADLLQLGALGRTFDAIESVGVLHHLADPWQGWRALLALLRPGGFMKLGFYSALARREVERIRNEIAAGQYTPTPDGIRACRQVLMQQGELGQFGMILSSPDFFSTSACRDLLFHVQEHCMTLNPIAAFLREEQLRFLGFELDGRVMREYRTQFPHDRAATDLSQWKVYEDERPQTFGNMYQFWIQKPAT